jgi:hypothetical protein
MGTLPSSPEELVSDDEAREEEVREEEARVRAMQLRNRMEAEQAMCAVNQKSWEEALSYQAQQSFAKEGALGPGWSPQDAWNLGWEVRYGPSKRCDLLTGWCFACREGSDEYWCSKGQKGDRSKGKTASMAYSAQGKKGSTAPVGSPSRHFCTGCKVCRP